MLDNHALRAKIYQAGYKIKDLVPIIGINETTFYKKMRGSSEFTRKEIEILISTLRIENPLEIFFKQ